MATERTVERPDGSVERTTTSDRAVVTERRGGGGTIVALVLGVIAILVVGYFLMNMSRSEEVESNAIAGAAESVGAAADNVGDAASRVVPPAQ